MRAGETHPNKTPPLIGLIGGVAAGKSTVARWLADHGALWLDSDKAAREVLELPDVMQQLRVRFSDSVVDSHGKVDRKAVASRVFGTDPAAVANRLWLEGLIHPRVRALTEQRIAEAGDRYPAIVIDAPLLLEAGWGEACDCVLFVDTPLELRAQFAAARGWTPEEFAKREESQLSITEKRKRATAVVVNDGSLEKLYGELEQFWTRLMSGDLSAGTR
ncbi:MAG: dephospho-CoA kinase [Aureliella sp.]